MLLDGHLDLMDALYDLSLLAHAFVECSYVLGAKYFQNLGQLALQLSVVRYVLTD